jgi:hypothetical protein
MRPQNLTRGRRGILKMKLQGSGVFHPKTLPSQNCQPAKNRLSLNRLDFVHGQLLSSLGLFSLGHGVGPLMRAIGLKRTPLG